MDTELQFSEKEILDAAMEEIHRWDDKPRSKLTNREWSWYGFVALTVKRAKENKNLSHDKRTIKTED